jgi:MoxR-like ATPase
MFATAQKKSSIDSASREKLQAMRLHLRAHVSGQEEAVESALITLLAGGHLLLEGPPGVGKTSLAQSLSQLFRGTFRRLQMTSDLLPSDVVGTLRLKPGTSDFEFRQGPVFSNVLLADELNRTSAKTQAALLEAMAEGKVTVDGVTYDLPNPFFVVATQNPQEFHGVYPLSESQLDRFMIHVLLALPEASSELNLYREHAKQESRVKEVTSGIVGPEELLALRAEARRVFMEETVLQYTYDVAKEMRRIEDVTHAASVRSVLQLIDAAKARALLEGRDYVIPNDVATLAPAVLAHRLCFRAGDFSSTQRKDIVRHALARVVAPK